ncbi:hypothetical protein LCGC14_2625640 [marine sediment metagenome]|uniref:PIN domain-containing protein n=1 Tax=marine sediment metagenome TaxID=412755 RepID=A0A0F9APD7_9ZZZZ|nr:PIN domain-containing protein [Spirochaetota bacterium]
MKYWDSSAIIPLIVHEAVSERQESFLRIDPEIVTWWGSKIEITSALNRLSREGALDSIGIRRAFLDVETLASAWLEIQATEKLRNRAIRLLRVHPLRAMDAIQLSASLIAADENPQTLPFVCSDTQLAEAAEKEGFMVLP